MFKATTTEPQLGIFSNPSMLLSRKSETFYEKQDAWHNLFRVQVTSRIDESICKPLFAEQTGAPNAPIRVLIAMMALKEGNGWSDEQLFEQCRFNLLVRSALGLVNMDDCVPVESTYYLLRKRVVEYEKDNEINLIEKTMSSITKGQAVDFAVSGKSIRMDSKLLGSNIAWYTRYELIHETIRLFCEDVREILFTHPLLATQKEVLENLLKETGNKVVYRSSQDEVKTKMQQLGILASHLIEAFNPANSKHYTTLSRVFSEQFKINEDKIIITRNKEEIKSDSVQSPHDTDCNYRNKDGNQIKGYSINATESCDGEGLNLICGVDVRVVSTPDNDFLQNGVKQAKEIFLDTIKHLHTDGAYHSPDNQCLCKEENIDWLINAIQGAKGRFDLLLSEENELTITDTQTGEIMEVTKLKKQEKWRINTNNGYKYFTEKEITASALRRKIAAIPQVTLNKRNNVEATIFQIGFHYPNDKSRYRGLIKHKMWANIRCMWVNFVRIKLFVTKLNKKTLFWPNLGSYRSLLTQFSICIMSFKLFLSNPIRSSLKLNLIRI